MKIFAFKICESHIFWNIFGIKKYLDTFNLYSYADAHDHRRYEMKVNILVGKEMIFFCSKMNKILKLKYFSFKNTFLITFL